MSFKFISLGENTQERLDTFPIGLYMMCTC